MYECGQAVTWSSALTAHHQIHTAAAAAAKSLQSYPTVRTRRRQPTRLPRPWDSPGKNTGVRSHFLLQCMKVKSESEVAHVRLLATPWTAAHPALPSMGFSRQEYWSGCHCILRKSILGRNYTHVQNVAKPLIRNQFSLHICEFILQRNLTNVQNVAKALVTVAISLNS